MMQLRPTQTYLGRARHQPLFHPRSKRLLKALRRHKRPVPVIPTVPQRMIFARRMRPRAQAVGDSISCCRTMLTDYAEADASTSTQPEEQNMVSSESGVVALSPVSEDTASSVGLTATSENAPTPEPSGQTIGTLTSAMLHTPSFPGRSSHKLVKSTKTTSPQRTRLRLLPQPPPRRPLPPRSRQHLRPRVGTRQSVRSHPQRRIHLIPSSKLTQSAYSHPRRRSHRGRERTGAPPPATASPRLPDLRRPQPPRPAAQLQAPRLPLSLLHLRARVQPRAPLLTPLARRRARRVPRQGRRGDPGGHEGQERMEPQGHRARLALPTAARHSGTGRERGGVGVSTCAAEGGRRGCGLRAQGAS